MKSVLVISMPRPRRWSASGASWRAACLLAAAAWLLGGVPQRAAAAEAGMMAYRARIEGLEDKSLRRKLEAAAVTMRQRRVGVRDAETLAWRAGRDAETLRELLMAEGYRRAAVSAAIYTREHRIPLELVLQVTPGPLYRLTQVTVAFGDVVDDRLAARIESMAQELVGQPAQADLILRSELHFHNILRGTGHADARIGTRRVRIYHDTSEAQVEYLFFAGPHGLFGETRIEGLQRVKSIAVERKIPWEQGEIFSLTALELGRKRLLDSDLFLSVRVLEQKPDAFEAPSREYGPDPEPLAVPVKIMLRERKHRSVGLGLHYYSDEGFAARLFGEHRNLRGHGERLRLETRYSGFFSDLRIRLEIPDFRRLEQTLTHRLHWEDERTDVFDSRRWDFESRIERRLTPRFTGGVGGGYLIAEVQEPGDSPRQYQLAYVPLSLAFDSRDNPLHPTRGLRMIARVVPYFDVRAPEEAGQFYKTHLQLEGHQALVGRDRLGLALRATGGTILGAGLTRRVPIDQRFYSGGGGSVRGYAYQRLGPERNGRPTGGRSLAETSAELRSRWGANWGTALFLDGGMAFSEMIPESLSPMRWSVGIGLRFFTGVGPLRIDLAFPLQRRSELDAPFSIYIGLGQAF